MLIDTHCHINIMVRGYETKSEDVAFNKEELSTITNIIEQAYHNDTQLIINVGTDLIESISCIRLAKMYKDCYAIVGIHPNDATDRWRDDIKKLHTYVKDHQEHKIIGIGECGIDFHYEGYNLSKQQDVFKAQIELALTYNLALSIHSRDAAEETFAIIDEYRKEADFRGIMHCYSYDQGYADEALQSNLVLGIGGTVTYPRNDMLRSIVKNTPFDKIVLETDAPFLPPQSMRGKQNSPANIKIVAEYIAQLKNISYEQVAEQTTQTVKKIFNL